MLLKLSTVIRYLTIKLVVRQSVCLWSPFLSRIRQLTRKRWM